MKASDPLSIDFAGPEPEAEPEPLLPEPLDNSAKLNMTQAEELLLDSVKSDVQTFMTHWKDCNAGLSEYDLYPAELTADGWYQQFYAWMGV